MLPGLLVSAWGSLMCWKHGLSEVRAQAAGLGEMMQVPVRDWWCQTEVAQEIEGTTCWCFQLERNMMGGKGIQSLQDPHWVLPGKPGAVSVLYCCMTRNSVAVECSRSSVLFWGRERMPLLSRWETLILGCARSHLHCVNFSRNGAVSA